MPAQGSNMRSTALRCSLLSGSSTHRYRRSAKRGTELCEVGTTPLPRPDAVPASGPLASRAAAASSASAATGRSPSRAAVSCPATAFSAAASAPSASASLVTHSQNHVV